MTDTSDWAIISSMHRPGILGWAFATQLGKPYPDEPMVVIEIAEHGKGSRSGKVALGQLEELCAEARKKITEER